MNRIYDIETRVATTIVSVSGDLNLSSSGIFSIVAELSTQPLERLIISLEHCTHCDSSALTMLVRAHNMMKRGSLLVVIPENSRCRRVFEITGLVKLLQVVPTLESALRHETVAA
jgi:anti-anti-sigma factor